MCPLSLTPQVISGISLLFCFVGNRTTVWRTTVHCYKCPSSRFLCRYFLVSIWGDLGHWNVDMSSSPDGAFRKTFIFSDGKDWSIAFFFPFPSGKRFGTWKQSRCLGLAGTNRIYAKDDKDKARKSLYLEVLFTASAAQTLFLAKMKWGEGVLASCSQTQSRCIFISENPRLTSVSQVRSPRHNWWKTDKHHNQRVLQNR